MSNIPRLEGPVKARSIQEHRIRASDLSDIQRFKRRIAERTGILDMVVVSLRFGRLFRRNFVLLSGTQLRRLNVFTVH